MSKDYYKILGVEKNASAEEIKKAFRKKAHEHHPDKTGGDDSKFKEANEAYQVLGDQKKRAQYDQFGSNFSQGGFGGGQGFGGGYGTDGFNINMDDLGDMFGGFGDIFGFGGGGRGQSQQNRRGQDIQAIMSLTFMEAVFGVEKEVNLRKAVQCGHCHGNGAEPGSKVESCPTCGGTGRVHKVQRTVFGAMQVQAVCDDCGGEGKKISKKCSKCSGMGVIQETVSLKVKIPAGIGDGESIRLTGQGEAGIKGAGSGDLYLRVKIEADKRFVRVGYDIKSKASISFTQAALGDKIEVETVDGSIMLKIPEGTQSSTVFKLKDRGVPHLNSRNRGSHFVEVIIKTPTNLSRKQKELLKDFGE